MNAFQRPKFDPYSLTYNPGWAKHPNFSWTRPNALMRNAQGVNFQGNSLTSPYQKPPFLGAHNSPRGSPSQPIVAKSFPPSSYNDLDKVNQKVMI